jgi:hypothetical protein
MQMDAWRTEKHNTQMDAWHQEHMMHIEKERIRIEREALDPKKDLTSRFMTEMFQNIIDSHGMAPQRSNDMWGANTTHFITALYLA